MPEDAIAAPDFLVLGRRLLAEALSVKVDELPDKPAIGEYAAWTSLSHMRLIFAIEKQMGKELSAATVVGIGSLADLVTVLQNRELPSSF